MLRTFLQSCEEGNGSILTNQFKGFAADERSLEFDSRVLGDLVLPLIV